MADAQPKMEAPEGATDFKAPVPVAEQGGPKGVPEGKILSALISNGGAQAEHPDDLFKVVLMGTEAPQDNGGKGKSAVHDVVSERPKLVVDNNQTGGVPVGTSAETGGVKPEEPGLFSRDKLLQVLDERKKTEGSPVLGDYMHGLNEKGLADMKQYLGTQAKVDSDVLNRGTQVDVIPTLGAMVDANQKILNTPTLELNGPDDPRQAMVGKIGDKEFRGTVGDYNEQLFKYNQEKQLREKLANVGGEPIPQADQTPAPKVDAITNVADMTGQALTETQVAEKVQEVAAKQAENSGEVTETPQQKLDRLKQELGDKRKDFVKTSKWFSAHTAEDVMAQSQAKADYDASLGQYREQRLQMLKDKIASDPSMKDVDAETGSTKETLEIKSVMRELSAGEFLELQKAENELWQESKMGKMTETAKKLLEKYAGFNRRVSEALIGKDASGLNKRLLTMAVGGGVSAVTGGILRPLSSMVMANAMKEGSEAVAKKWREKRSEQAVEKGLYESTGGTGEVNLDKVGDWITDQSDGITDKWDNYKKLRFARTAVAGTAAAAFGFLMPRLSRWGGVKLHELVQTDTVQGTLGKAGEAVNDLVGVKTLDAAEPQPGDQMPTVIARATGDEHGVGDRLVEKFRHQVYEPVTNANRPDYDVVPRKEGLTLPTPEKSMGDLDQKFTNSLNGGAGIHLEGPNMNNLDQKFASSISGDAGIHLEGPSVEKISHELDVRAEGIKLPSPETSMSAAQLEQNMMTGSRPEVTVLETTEGKGAGATAQPEAGAAAKMYEVQKGDNLSRILYKKIDKLYPDLSDAQRNNIAANMIDRMPAGSIPSGNPNLLDWGEKSGKPDMLNLKKIMGSDQDIQRLVDHARDPGHNPLPRTEHPIRPRGSIGENRPGRPHLQEVKGGGRIGHESHPGGMDDLRNKANRLLGADGLKKPGESDADYLSRVRQTAIDQGKDLYGPTPYEKAIAEYEKISSGQASTPNETVKSRTESFDKNYRNTDSMGGDVRTGTHPTEAIYPPVRPDLDDPALNQASPGEIDKMLKGAGRPGEGHTVVTNLAEEHGDNYRTENTKANIESLKEYYKGLPEDEQHRISRNMDRKTIGIYGRAISMEGAKPEELKIFITFMNNQNAEDIMANKGIDIKPGSPAASAVGELRVLKDDAVRKFGPIAEPHNERVGDWLARISIMEHSQGADAGTSIDAPANSNGHDATQTVAENSNGVHEAPSRSKDYASVDERREAARIEREQERIDRENDRIARQEELARKREIKAAGRFARQFTGPKTDRWISILTR